MNSLTVRQRKAIYFGGGVLLLVVIVFLGAPLSRDQRFRSRLAQSREAHDLGEASLGNVDPASATMNLVLLGMRGVAASYLWYQADQQMQRKDFTDMQQTVNSIVMLQPHYRTVWEHQAWNLGYNVSTEYDAVDDRYFWVKQGAKFLQRGISRNTYVPELHFEMGQFLGRKLGTADEKEYYREFFRKDPDERRWHGGPDEEINPKNEDNYLVAQRHYIDANECLQKEGVRQHKMDIALFIAYPFRSLMDYAEGLQQDGIKRDLVKRDLTTAERETQFLEWSRNVGAAWANAFRGWTTVYGRERIQTAGGGGRIVLENDAEGLATMKEIAREEGLPIESKLVWQEDYRSLTSYPFWRRHADLSGMPEITRARYLFAEGKRLYRYEANFAAAREALQQGMSQMAAVIARYQVEDQVEGNSKKLLYDEQDIISDSLKALIVWRAALEFLNQPIPDDYPLREIWMDPDSDAKKQELLESFKAWTSSSG